jgi:alpha-L-rhamnosidase
MGATTIWERWDSLLPNGRVNPGEMTSFNHYALGAVADFLHRKVGGLAPLEPGYRAVEIAPVPGGGLTQASVAHDTAYGLCRVAWHRQGETLALDVELPTGVRAEVVLPGSSGRRHLVGGGTFHFTAPTRPAEADPIRPNVVNPHDPRQNPFAETRS